MHIDGITAIAAALALIALYLVAVVCAGQLLEDMLNKARGVRTVPVENREKR